MSNTTQDPRIKILIIATVLIIIGVISFSLLGNREESRAGNGNGKIVISEKSVDLGTVSMADGLAHHTFKFKNEGDGVATISDIKTSCMCTTAKLSVNGDLSPKFGMQGHGINPVFWSKDIQPGQTVDLLVTFDPLAHGPNAVGPVTRSISFKSKEGGRTKRHSVTFKANVVK